MKQLIAEIQNINKDLENKLQVLKMDIEGCLAHAGVSKSALSLSMNKSRFYVNQVLWRDTTKPEVIIEIAEAVLKYEK